MFTGTYRHVLDDKGRLAIPAKFRPLLAEGLVVTRGTDHCLYLYSQASWNEIANKISSLPMGDPNARNLRRSFFGAAETVELDKQGRIVISQSLRDYAGLKSNVSIVGNFSFIEIWDDENWEEVDADGSARSSEIAATLSGLF